MAYINIQEGGFSLELFKNKKDEKTKSTKFNKKFNKKLLKNLIKFNKIIFNKLNRKTKYNKYKYKSFKNFTKNY
jgi:hypothetical protein